MTESDRATSWAVEKLCEDHLYWALPDLRWGDKTNFENGPARFFDAIPAPIRPLVTRLVRNKTLKAVKAHGLGRHTRPQIERLAIHDLRSLSAILGAKPFLMGDQPCAADSSVLSLVAGIMSPVFETPVRAAAESLTNLVAYRDRMTASYFAIPSA